jgi:dinuclear metal center YbgI/SA1388 family protein
MPGLVRVALEWGADFILTHHPLYFQPKPLDRRGDFLETVALLLSSGAWLYSAHTSMDALSRGPAGWLADALELSRRRVLESTDPDNPDAGLGIVGHLREELSFEEFTKRLAGAVKRNFWTVSGDAPETVQTVAYCTGSGGSLISTAEQAGADVYVTGDVKYHQALEARICVIDVGHYSLEERMLHLFGEKLSRELSPEGVGFKFFRGLDPFRVHMPEADGTA